MEKYDFEKQISKLAKSAEKKLGNIENILRDLSMKLCHVIRYKKLANNDPL